MGNLRDEVFRCAWRNGRYIYHVIDIIILECKHLRGFYIIVGNIIVSEAGKIIIRNSLPHQIAEQMCNAIDDLERGRTPSSSIDGVR